MNIIEQILLGVCLANLVCFLWVFYCLIRFNDEVKAYSSLFGDISKVTKDITEQLVKIASQIVLHDIKIGSLDKMLAAIEHSMAIKEQKKDL